MKIWWRRKFMQLVYIFTIQVRFQKGFWPHCAISWAKSFEKRRWPIQKMVHGPNSTKGTKPWRMLMCKYTWGEHTCQHHPQGNWNFIVEYRFLLFWFSLKMLNPLCALLLHLATGKMVVRVLCSIHGLWTHDG